MKTPLTEKKNKKLSNLEGILGQGKVNCTTFIPAFVTSKYN